MTDPEDVTCDCGHTARIHTIDGCQSGTLSDPCRCALSSEGVAQQWGPEPDVVEPTGPAKADCPICGERFRTDQKSLRRPDLPRVSTTVKLDEHRAVQHPDPAVPSVEDVFDMLAGSSDYRGWKAAVQRAVDGGGVLPSLPRVLPVGELVDEAFATAGTQPITAAGAHGKHVPGSRTLADVDRLIALHDMGDAGIGALNVWARVAADDLHTEGRDDDLPADTIRDVTDWLAARIDWLANQPWWDEMARDVAALHGALRRICRITPRPTWTCPECGDIAEEMPGSEWMLCRSGHQLPGTAVMRRQVASRWLTARQVREAHGIPEGTLWRWKHDRWIEPAGRKEGADLWSEWDVLQVRHTIACGETPATIDTSKEDAC